MKNITRDNLTDTVKSSFANIDGERQRHLVNRLVHHLHAFASETGAPGVTVTLDNRYATRTDAQGRFVFAFVGAGARTVGVRNDTLPLPWSVVNEGQARIDKVRDLAALAGRIGMPLHHMALAWCLTNPRVSTVILGASRLSQLTDNLAALDRVVDLTPDVLAEIEAIMANKPAAPQRF